MTIPGQITETASHLTALAAELASAQDSDPADPARIAEAAWSILGELTAASYARIISDLELARAIQAAQASVIDARTGAADPLVHLRGFLTPRGKMPPKDATTLVTLAWLGERRSSPASAPGHRSGGRVTR